MMTILIQLLIDNVSNIIAGSITSLFVGFILWRISVRIDNNYKNRIDNRTYKAILRNGMIILNEYKHVRSLSNELDENISRRETIDYYLEKEYTRLKTCIERIHDLHLNMYNITSVQDNNINIIITHSEWVINTYFNTNLTKNARLPKYTRLQDKFHAKISELEMIIENTHT